MLYGFPPGNGGVAPPAGGFVPGKIRLGLFDRDVGGRGFDPNPFVLRPNELLPMPGWIRLTLESLLITG